MLVETLASFNAKYGVNRRLQPATIRHLIDYSWPGNVRELRNIVERLVVTAVNDTIGPDSLPTGFMALSPVPTPGDGLKVQIRKQERDLVVEAVKRTGNTRAAASELGISQSTVVRKLRVR